MKMKRILMLMLAAFAVTAAVSPPYQVGDVVDDFSLKNTDGKKISLSDYKNEKGVIVIFDCNTCPYSKNYNDRIIGLHKKYKSSGFPVITINANDSKMSPGDSYEDMVALAKKKKYDFPYLIDETQEVAKAFGATNTPHVYLLKSENSQFKIVYIGAIDNNSRDASAASKKYVEEAIDALLENKPVPTEKTKAVGCGIKYRKS